LGLFGAMRLRYNLIEDAVSVYDEEGIVVVDLEAARTVALKAAREIMAEDLKQTGAFSLRSRIDITDESGVVVLSVPFSDVVTIGHA